MPPALRAVVTLLALAGIAGLAGPATAQNQPPNAVFSVNPPPYPGGAVYGTSPFEVTFNMCKSTDPDPGDELKFLFDFDGDGRVDFFGACRSPATYVTTVRELSCKTANICVTDRQPDHLVCQQFEICVRFGTEEDEAGPAAVLYAATGGSAASSLRILNPANGSVSSTVGPIGFAITGLAMHPATKVLYAATSANSPGAAGALVRINTTTGAGTLVGGFGGAAPIADLAFSPSGTLYGWGEGTDDLYTVNLATGAAALVGDSGLGTYGSGLAFSPGGTLFFAGEGNGPSLFASGRLRTVNPATGLTSVAATLSGSPGPAGSSVAALSFGPDGLLYGVVLDFNSGIRPTFLVTIDSATGVVGNRGSSVNMLDAIAWSVP